MKKRLICSFLVTSMLFSNCCVYAEEMQTAADEVIEIASESNEEIAAESTVDGVDDVTVSSQAADADVQSSGNSGTTEAESSAVTETTEDNDTPLSAYVTDTGFVEVLQTDPNTAKEYTLTVKSNYVLDNTTDLCCQITNISKDVECDVVIPPEIEITLADGSKVFRKVRAVADSAFEAAKVTSVTLPETIREIGPKAFLNCTNLKTLNIKGVFTAMKQAPMPLQDENGNYVYTAQLDENGKPVYDRYGKPVYQSQTDASGAPLYYETIDTENLTMASSSKRTIDTTIGANAFQGCTALEDVSISGFQKIGDMAFYGCTALKNVDFSTEGMYTATALKAVTANGASDFEIYSGKNNTVELPMVFGKNIFENCTGLETITLAKNIKTLGVSTFKGCTGLKTVNVGPTLSGVLNAASFEGCTSMENVSVVAENVTFSSFDGILYKGNAKKPTSLEYCPPMNKIHLTDENGLWAYPEGTYVLPDTVTAIADNALNNNNNLVKLIANNSVKIGKSVCKGCENLKEVHLNSFATIGNEAFKDCTSLAVFEHTYNEGIIKQTIGQSAFEGCNALGDLTLYGWAEIGANAFKNCKGITNLVASESIGTIGNNAFEGCSSMETADLSLLAYNVAAPANSKFTFGTYILKDCTSLKHVDLPIAVDGISAGTCQNCTSLETVTSGESTGSICSLAFDNCISLTTPPSPRFLVRIDAGAFNGCTSLADFPMTRSVMIIDKNAFTGCGSVNIIAPEQSKAYEYATNNGMLCTPAIDDIADEEFLRLSGNRIIGYRGGFESLTIPKDYFSKRGIASEDLWLDNNWINQAYGGSTCSMKTFLKYIDLGEVNVIGALALSGTALETADLGNARYIFRNAFASCKTLTEVTIPNTVDYMDNAVFNGCTGLKKLVFEAPEITGIATGDDGIPVISSLDDVPTIAFKTLTDNTSQGVITVNKAKSNGQFTGCTSLEEVSIETTKVHTQSTDAAEQAKVKEVAKLGLITENMFANCSSLTSIVLPYNCRSLDKDNPAVGKTAFNGCKSLETVKFGVLTDNIGQAAFQNCTSIKTVTLPHNVTVGKEAFKGCTGINRIIIPQTAKLAISDTPFIDTKEADVLCDKTSNNLTYFTAFNDPESNLSLFMSEATAKSYVGKYHYNIEYSEFLEGTDSVIVKGKLTVPDGVTVTKDGTELKTGDFVIGGDVLTITANKVQGIAQVIFANNTVVPADGVYVVPENEDVTISLVTKKQCKLNIANGAIVKNGDITLTNGSYVMSGDVLTITFEPSEKEIRSLTVNGNDFESGNTFAVTDASEEITIGIKAIANGRITIPDGVTVVRDGAQLKSGDYVTGSDKLMFSYTPSSDKEKLCVNGTPVDVTKAYTPVQGKDIILTVEEFKGIWGDVTMDGSLAADDAAAALQITLNSNSFSKEAAALADVDADGSVTATDAACILQKVLDSSFMFEVEK